MQKLPVIAVVTYNQFPPYPIAGIYEIHGKNVLILPRIFDPKGPASVTLYNSNMQLLIKNKDSLKKVLFFAGKLESGALEIIKIFSESFSSNLSCLSVVLCNHGLKEKLELLKSRNIPKEQILIFSDGFAQCNEVPILKGLMYDFLDSIE